MRLFSAAALMASASIEVTAFVSINRSTQVRHTNLPAHISTSEDSPRNLADFEEWCTQYGVQKMDGVQLYSEDGLDYQLVTTADIPAGTALLYIPVDMVLSSNRIAVELNSMSDGSVANAISKLGKMGGADSVAKFQLFLKGQSFVVVAVKNDSHR